MKQYSYTINKLPNEIIFFKNLTKEETDPIKKYIFNLSELKYIMKNIRKFSVSLSNLTRTNSLKNNDILLNLLIENYIGDCYTNKCMILSEDYKYIKEFICMFFDYDKPLYSRKLYDRVWIYPKLDIQNFISKALFQYNLKTNKDKVYLNEYTLNKLLTIFTNFTKYEYDSLNDEEISYLFDGVNYPSLILANIDLYEKGYIEIVEEFDEIKILFNKERKNSSKKDNFIFTSDRDFLKIQILEFINSDSIKYSLEDFL